MKTINAICRIFMLTFVLLLVSIILKIGLLSMFFFAGLTVEFMLFYKTRNKMEDTAREYMKSYEEYVRNYYIYSCSKDLERRELAKEIREKAVNTANAYNSYLKEIRQVWGDELPEGLLENLSTDF